MLHPRRLGVYKKFSHTEATRKKISLSLRKFWKEKATPEQTKRKSLIQKGKKHTEETKRKIAQTMRAFWKEKTISTETKQKMSLAHKGKKRKTFSEDHKRKLSLAQTGKKHTKERRRKMTETRRRKSLLEKMAKMDKQPLQMHSLGELKENERDWVLFLSELNKQII